MFNQDEFAPLPRPSPGRGGNRERAVRNRRVALYSHDTMGIGHMRRNLLIAQALAHGPQPVSILLVAGAREVGAFGLPPGVDCLTLPSLFKDDKGEYQSRHLDISLDELISLRGKSIRAALEAFAPDLLIVDKVPRGALGELEPTLEYLRQDGLSRCVLGLRDVLDDAPSVCREWIEADNEEAIRRYYDAIWIYGDASVFDPVSEYGLSSDVAAKVRFTGYLHQPERSHVGEINAATKTACLEGVERLVLCLVGGGQDGALLAETFAQAKFPLGTTGVILTGPFMPAEAQARLRRRALENPQLRVVGFVTDADLLLSRAERVVAMGGYNTVCEILAFGKPALIVPRVKPRLEQWIRAERLQALGFLDVTHPDALNPRLLTEWLQREPKDPPPLRGRIAMDGVAKLGPLMREALSASPQSHRFRPPGGGMENRPARVVKTSERISHHGAR
jgi:predicted glycosyltransferase